MMMKTRNQNEEVAKFVPEVRAGRKEELTEEVWNMKVVLGSNSFLWYLWTKSPHFSYPLHDASIYVMHPSQQPGYSDQLFLSL